MCGDGPEGAESGAGLEGDEGAGAAESEEKSFEERESGADGEGEEGEADGAGLNENRLNLPNKPPPPAPLVAPFVAREGVGLSLDAGGEATPEEVEAEGELASARSTGSKMASPVNSTPRLANFATRWSVPADRKLV